MAGTFGTEDFIVDGRKTAVVKETQKRIEQMFNVMISFETVSQEGQNESQWLVVSGGKHDRRSAQNYIMGLCNPQEVLRLKCDGELPLDIDIIEGIEQSTAAVITQLGSSELTLAGSDMSCTLALSKLEELYQVHIVNKDDKGQEVDCYVVMDQGTGDKDNFENQGKSNKQTKSVASQRLDTSLEQSLSQLGNGTCKTEYASAPDSVKRAILESLKENFEDSYDDSMIIIDDEQLYGFGSEGGKSIGSPLPSNVETDSPYNRQLSRSDSGTSAQNSEKNGEYFKPQLRIWGKEMGFSVDDIEESLQFFDCSKDVEWADFIQKVDEIKSKNSEISKANLIFKIEKQTGEKEQSAKGKRKIEEPKKGAGTLNRSQTSVGTQLLVNSKTPDDEPKSNIIPQNNADRGSGQTCTVSSKVRDTKNENLKSGSSASNIIADANASIIMLDATEADEDICLVDAFPLGSKQPTHGLGGVSAQERKQLEQQQQERKMLFQKQAAHGGRGKAPKVRGRSADRMKQRQGNRMATVNQELGNKNMEPVAGFKRKQYTEDDEQTSVMKPYGTNQSSNFNSGNRQQVFNQEPAHNNISVPVQVAGNFRGVLPPSNSPQAIGTMSQPFSDDLRYIVIDGSNLAMSHGNGKNFSCKGIQLCIDYFVARGHKQIIAFVPEWRKYRHQRDGAQVIEPEILEHLKEKRLLAYTPSRRLNGKFIASHDDRYILNLAVMEDAVVVSNDQYREFILERSTYRHIIENRLLPYSFVGDHFMPPDDPLGRSGPCLEEFLRKGKRVPLQGSPRVSVTPSVTQQPPRSPRETENLIRELKRIFPSQQQDPQIRFVIQNHASERDLNSLINYFMDSMRS